MIETSWIWTLAYAVYMRVIDVTHTNDIRLRFHHKERCCISISIKSWIMEIFIFGFFAVCGGSHRCLTFPEQTWAIYVNVRKWSPRFISWNCISVYFGVNEFAPTLLYTSSFKSLCSTKSCDEYPWCHLTDDAFRCWVYTYFICTSKLIPWWSKEACNV